MILANVFTIHRESHWKKRNLQHSFFWPTLTLWCPGPLWRNLKAEMNIQSIHWHFLVSLLKGNLLGTGIIFENSKCSLATTICWQKNYAAVLLNEWVPLLKFHTIININGLLMIWVCVWAKETKRLTVTVTQSAAETKISRMLFPNCWKNEVVSARNHFPWASDWAVPSAVWKCSRKVNCTSFGCNSM